MVEIEIGEMSPDEVTEAARMLARAFRDNPSTVSMHGDDPLERCAALLAGFSRLLPRYEAPALVARGAGLILGAAGRGREGGCLGAYAGLLRDTPEARASLSEHVREWLFAWADHDPTEPHWHLAPIGVEPTFQGMRIGSAMLERFCEAVDGDGVIAWLETDRPQNVRLYERFGFAVVEEIDILGVRNWWMRREAR